MNHPKYTLVISRDFYEPFHLMEHVTLTETAEDGTSQTKVGSRKVIGFRRLEDALMELAMKSEGPVVLAASFQPIDNVHDLSKG